MIWLFSKSRNFNFNRFERDINREPNFHKTRTLRFIGCSNTELTRFVARGPRASQCRLYLKTSNQVNLV